MQHKRTKPEASLHSAALLKGLLVTFLWAIGWVLIKVGLTDMPPLTFAGLRFFLAFIWLSCLYFPRYGIRLIRAVNRRTWFALVLFGIINFGMSKGAHFLSLSYLPAVTVNFLFQLSPILVVLAGIFIPTEKAVGAQWAGTIIGMLGVFLFFYPFQTGSGPLAGYLFAAAGLIGTTVSLFIGRYVNLQSGLSALTVTLLSMGIGGSLLLITGIFVEGIPAINPKSITILLTLSLLCTAVAFNIWNDVMRHLNALELSMLSTMQLAQVALLAVLFLGESLSLAEIGGMVLVTIGGLVVQFGKYFHLIDFKHITWP